MGRLSHSRYSEGNQIHAMHVGNKKRMIKLRVQDKRPHVVVLGAGIIGLSSAYVLANTPVSSGSRTKSKKDNKFLPGHPFRVTVVAKEFTPGTTSDVAAGVWGPIFAFPKDKILKWSAITKDECNRHMQTGEFPVSSLKVQLFLKERELGEEDTYFKYLCPDWTVLTEKEELRGCKTGVQYTAPLTPSYLYMPAMMSKLRALGVQFVQRDVKNIKDLFNGEPVSLVVNCTGIGAQTVVSDSNLTPKRGVIVCIPPDPRLTGKCIEEGSNEESFCYMVAREDCIILGGTANVTSNKSTKLSELDRIIEKNVQLVPELADHGDPRDRIIALKIGLRPTRPAGIRLELDNSFSVPVIHNYGHGGSGWTLFWGCAQDVHALALQVLSKPKL